MDGDVVLHQKCVAQAHSGGLRYATNEGEIYSICPCSSNAALHGVL